MAVRLAAFNRARAELELASAIAVAREAQISWHAVGETIGISGDTARRRYGGKRALATTIRFLRSVAESSLAEAIARANTGPRSTVADRESSVT